MKKVLYVSPNGYLGGAERFVLTAVKSHNQHSQIDSSILFFSNGEAVAEAIKSGIKVHILQSKFKLTRLGQLFKALLEIRKLVKEIKPDILHLTMPYAHITMSLATMGLGIKKVWFQHGPVGGRLDQIANLFPVDVLIYNSSDLKERHHLTSPQPIVKVQETILFLGVNSSHDIRQIFQGPSVILGTAGRICSWKGFHQIILALGKLKNEMSLPPFIFYLAGAAKTDSDQAYARKLEQLVRSQNLAESFVFKNHVADMPAFYREIDVFIHSSTIPEPFGLVVAEAMGQGCLVIGSDQGGVRDLINFQTGIAYPSTSENAVDALKVKIQGLLLSSNKSDYQKLAQAGHEHIRKNYSIEKMRINLEAIYQKL